MIFIAPRVTEYVFSESRVTSREIETRRETELCIFQRGDGTEAGNVTPEQES